MDIRTLVAVLAISTSVASLAIFVIHRLRFPVQGTIYWVYGNLLAALGLILTSFRGFIPAFGSIVIANVIIALGYGLVWSGMRVFLGKSSRLGLAAVISLLLLPLLFWFSQITPNLAVRTVLMSVWLGGFSLAIFAELWQENSGLDKVALRLTAAVYAANALVLLLRIFFVLGWKPDTPYFATGYVTSALFLWSIVFVLLYTAGWVLLIGEKLKEEIKTLKGILPICAICKKIRDDQGYWNRLETYLDRHSEAAFSHGICPECQREHYPEDGADR